MGEAEIDAGRRIMGFGHAVYRTRDPRSALLRDVAESLGGELVDHAVDIEGRILDTLRRLKPDRPLPSNVEFFAGVVMAAAGLPRALFTPTFAVSRTIGWTTHAVEQAAEGKLIRPSARYVGPAAELAAARSGRVSLRIPQRSAPRSARLAYCARSPDGRSRDDWAVATDARGLQQQALAVRAGGQQLGWPLDVRPRRVARRVLVDERASLARGPATAACRGSGPR